MKSVVLEEPGKLVMKELAMPVCGDGDVLIRVRACNICKTDVKCTTIGQRDLVYPRILGHEIAGVVIEKGKKVAGNLVGERVYVHPGISCGQCEYCKSGQNNLCDQMEIMGFNFDGGFQEIIKITPKGVKGKVIQVINNDELAYEEISFIEPLACCVNIQDSLKMNKATVLVIIGGGRLGLLNLFTAKAEGIKTVILIEKNETRRNRGKELGFDAVFSGNETDLMEQIKAVTAERGVDAVIPCCPGPKALDLGLKLLRKKGSLGYFSGITRDEGFCPEINLIHYKEITVVGSYGCSVAHSRKARSLLEARKIDVRPLISHRVQLEELMLGMDYVKNCDGYSTIVRMK